MVVMAGRELALETGAPSILTAIDDEETTALTQLAKHQRVLEIGSAYGFSSIAMALAGATSVLTIDPHAGECPDSLETLRANIEAYGVAKKVVPVVAYSQEALPELSAKRQRYGLVFVDGEHSAKSVAHDVEHGWALLGKGGTLVCHDYGTDGCRGVQEALDARWPDGPDELVGTLWIKRKEQGR